jgi:hypothetical protein
MRPLQAHCHLGLGTLYSRVGRVRQARAALFAAIELYRAMDMTFWLPQAEATLVQIGGDGRGRREFTSGIVGAALGGALLNS